jgi:transcriptional regulator with XRE-family HTH domain
MAAGIAGTISEGLGRYAIGEKLRSLRLHKTMGLVELGKHTGLSAGLLSKLERGKLFPTLPTLLRIAMVFGVGLEYFFTDESKRRAVGVVRREERVRFPERPSAQDVQYYFERLSGRFSRGSGGETQAPSARWGRISLCFERLADPQDCRRGVPSGGGGRHLLRLGRGPHLPQAGIETVYGSDGHGTVRFEPRGVSFPPENGHFPAGCIVGRKRRWHLDCYLPLIDRGCLPFHTPG